MSRRLVHVPVGRRDVTCFDEGIISVLPLSTINVRFSLAESIMSITRGAISISEIGLNETEIPLFVA
jgi:hypothetical protein